MVPRFARQVTVIMDIFASPHFLQDHEASYFESFEQQKNFVVSANLKNHLGDFDFFFLIIFI